jgi:hypothetical protein
MLANKHRVNTIGDVDELVFFLGHVKEATSNFVDLGNRFRAATSRNINPNVLKHEINTVFALQAGDLLCRCWRREMLSVYRPDFYVPDEGDPRIRYVFSWFMFIRWHLATIYKTRFRDDWKSEFAPELDQLKGQDHNSWRDYQSAASQAVNDLVVWRLNLHADVQATACDILAEELGQLAETVTKRLKEIKDQNNNGGGRGRKPSPKIQARNKEIIKMFAQGFSVNDVTTRFRDVSAKNARKIKSENKAEIEQAIQERTLKEAGDS